MTNKETQQDYFENIKAYQQGLVAANLARTEESMQYIPGALINLAKDVNLSGPATMYEEVCNATPGANQKLIEIAAERYNQEKKKVNLGELFDWYTEGIIDKVSEEKAKEIKGLFGEYLDKTIEDIEEEIADAGYTLNKRTNSSEEDKKTARENIEQKKELLGKLNLLESYSLEKGRQRAVEATIKPTLESLVK